MALVVFDSLSYFYDADGNVVKEGFDGFRVEENFEGRLFVIYKEVAEQQEMERRFVLPDGVTINQFMALEQRYRDLFAKQRYLFRMMVAAERRLGDQRSEDNLREVCDQIYSWPENYVHFVAMNMVKSQFFLLAKERILNGISTMPEELIAACN